MKKFFRPALAAVVCGISVGMLTAPPARAMSRYYAVDVSVTWTDRTCVDVMEPSSVDRARLVYSSACRANGMASVSYLVSSGEYFGVDPIMGDNTYIHCSAALNGQMMYNSWARAGDGTDVNCLGIAP